MPKNNTAIYTQAQMDLGATVCFNKNPNCIKCPVKKKCLAFKLKSTDKYPIKETRVRKKIKEVTFYLYLYNDEILFIKNPDFGIWGGLYILPNKKIVTASYSSTLCKSNKTIFTHLNLIYNIEVYKVDFKKPDNNNIWIKSDAIDINPIPPLFKKHLNYYFLKDSLIVK